MDKIRVSAVVVACALLVGIVALPISSADDKSVPADLDGWSADFSADKDDLVSTGRNPYFILEPGHQLVLEGDQTLLVVSVLDETKEIDGVETRVVEERESKKDQLVEVSRNFFAISRRTNNVYYFGEEVDDYKNGKIVGHPGAWRSGDKGARFGLMMPGFPLLKSRFYNEVAPKVAMDRSEIVGVGLTFKTPAGVFKNCLKVEETTPLEPDNTEHKHYAPGIGLIQDGDLKLVKYAVAVPVKSTAVASTEKKESDKKESEKKESEKKGDGSEEEVEIDLKDAPAAVQKTLLREAGGAKIKDVVKETEDGKTVYEAEVEIDDQEYKIVVAADGTLLEKSLEDDDDEIPVDWADVPPAVQKTLQREAAGAKIAKVDKFSSEGRTLYETDVKIDGKNYQITVTAEGLLLSKGLDEDEDE
jgi:uncharacterized membrane protein YkoI